MLLLLLLLLLLLFYVTMPLHLSILFITPGLIPCFNCLFPLLLLLLLFDTVITFGLVLTGVKL